MKKNEIIYALTIEDIQNVAEQTIDRHLSATEIIEITNSIAENIDWFNAIENAISKHQFDTKQKIRMTIT